MSKCRRKLPYDDFYNAVPNSTGTYESRRFIYTPDGLYRIKKSYSPVDKARCKISVLLEIRQQTKGY